MSYALTCYIIRVDLPCHTRCIAMSYAFPCLNVRVALACHTQGLQQKTWMLEYPIKILVIYPGTAYPGQCFSGKSRALLHKTFKPASCLVIFLKLTADTGAPQFRGRSEYINYHRIIINLMAVNIIAVIFEKYLSNLR